MQPLRPATRDRLSRRVFGYGASGLIASGFASRAARSTSAQEDGWQQIAAGASGPSPRWDHTLSAFDASKSLFVFGGRDGNGTALGDSWQFSRTREVWTPLDSPGPSPRFGHAVATDQEHELLYLFGGQAGSDLFNDLWQLDLANGGWKQIDDGGGAVPSPRYGTSMALSGGRELIVSHGFTFEGRFDDTWAHDIQAGGWTDISPELDLTRPLKRCLHEAVWVDHLD